LTFLTGFINRKMTKTKRIRYLFVFFTPLESLKRTLIFFLTGLTLLALIPASNIASEQDSSDKLPLEVSASVDKSRPFSVLGMFGIKGRDKDKITIGDKITYTLTVKAPKDIEIKFPEFAQNLGGFAIKDFGSSERGWFKIKTYRQWYVLDTYVSGEYSIPPSLIKYRRIGQDEWHEVSTDEVSIEVESILESAEDKRDIREIAGPIGFPIKIPWYMWVILAVTVLAAGIALFLFKRKKAKSTIIPPLPAHEIAYEALDALRQKEYLRRKEHKLYYIELSGIVRQYLENRFNLRAPEMTTEEFLNTVKDNKALSYEHKSLLRDFLSHCDLVKFAKYEPVEKEADLSFESAKRLIDQTKEEIKQDSKV